MGEPLVTAIRYVPSSGESSLSGAPLPRQVRVYYTLSPLEVRYRLEAAIRVGREGVAPADLRGLDSGTVREEVLERLFPHETLERSFVGTEAVGALRAV
jgi:hypothetical protein